MKNEIEKLTTEVRNLNGEIDELGRKSVPLIVKCGEKLKEQKRLLKHGSWENWCRETYKDTPSLTTIKRRIRVFEWYLSYRSLVTDLDLSKYTLDEVYELAGIVKKDTEKENNPDKNSKPPGTQNKQEKPTQTPFEKYRSLLSRVQDIKDETFSDTQTRQLVKCGDVFVKWFSDNGGEIPIKTVTPKPPAPPIVEMEDAA